MKKIPQYLSSTHQKNPYFEFSALYIGLMNFGQLECWSGALAVSLKSIEFNKTTWGNNLGENFMINYSLWIFGAKFRKISIRLKGGLGRPFRWYRIHRQNFSI